MARLLWFVVALWTLTAAAAVARAATDCSTVIPSVMDCLGFVSDGSTDPKPTKQCCVGIDGVIKNMPECLCEAVKVAPTVGNLNMTRILGLPDACTLKTPDLECIKNAMHPPPPAPAPAMASPTPAPAPQLPAPSPSPVTPPSAPSPLPPTTPTTPAAPPTTPPAPSPLPSVTAPPSASTPPAPSPVPSVASPPPPTPPMPSPPSSAPATPVTPPADDDVPAPAPNGTSKSSKAAKLATLMALAGSIGFVLSGLMP